MFEKFQTLDIEPLIAAEPARPRDSSRLLVLRRDTGQIEHRIFRDIAEYFKGSDCLVANNSKVFPARLEGKKTSGGKFELLLVRPENAHGRRWLALARECRPGVKVVFEEGLEAAALEKAENGEWIFEFSSGGVMEYAARHGKMPLPHYITKARRTKTAAGADSQDYQTVFAEHTGSIAAPTAGFHFTKPLLSEIKAKGVSTAEITLHVGWGTFRPVAAGGPQAHRMLPEFAEISAQACRTINAARAAGGRIFSTGTTTTRTLESFADSEGRLSPGAKWTDLFIYPPRKLKAIDALITNFHLPDSTPLCLAASFAGEEFLYKAYSEAVARKYRFYSYGDAMLIL